MPGDIIELLEFSAIIAAASGLLVFVVAVLGVLSAFSHRSFFRAAVLSRSINPSSDWDDAASLEFTGRRRRSTDDAGYGF